MSALSSMLWPRTRRNHAAPPQYIDSACLEPSTLQEEPVKYHEAWQKLCSSG